MVTGVASFIATLSNCSSTLVELISCTCEESEYQFTLSAETSGTYSRRTGVFRRLKLNVRCFPSSSATNDEAIALCPSAGFIGSVPNAYSSKFDSPSPSESIKASLGSEDLARARFPSCPACRRRHYPMGIEGHNAPQPQRPQASQ